jgi:hypothetical protein
MQIHTSILTQMYSILVGGKWELSDVPEYQLPMEGFYFCPIHTKARLSVSLSFQSFYPLAWWLKDQYGKMAVLTIYVPAERLGEENSIYLKYTAFDSSSHLSEGYSFGIVYSPDEANKIRTTKCEFIRDLFADLRRQALLEFQQKKVLRKRILELVMARPHLAHT